MSEAPAGIGIRHYAGDARRHAYREAALSAMELRRIFEIHPVCHESANSVLGHTHIFDMVNRTPFETLGGPFNACPGCAAWMGSHSHEVVVEGRVVTVRMFGELPVPEPRWTSGMPAGNCLTRPRPGQPPAFAQATPRWPLSCPSVREPGV